MEQTSSTLAKKKLRITAKQDTRSVLLQAADFVYGLANNAGRAGPGDKAVKVKSRFCVKYGNTMINLN